MPVGYGDDLKMPYTIQVFIIGGSHAGLGMAKHVLATLPEVKVTLISTSADYYFNLASPRLLARPSEVAIDELVIPIEKLFRRHDEKQFEFVHASVEELDPKAKIIFTDDGALRKYDYCIVASGSYTPAVISDPCIPVKQTVTDTLRDEITRSQKTIAEAQRIVIGGGGPVGIEIAGEIADAYPDKTITMVFAGFRLLDNLKGSASIEAGKKLNKLGIVVRSGVKVKSTALSKESREWTVTLTDDTILTADLFISAIGVVPNNSFLPSFLLSKTGWLKCDEFLTVKSVANMYAIGDIVEGQTKMAANIKSHIACVGRNLIVDIRQAGTREKLKLPFLEGMLVPIGSNGGTGQIGRFVPWNWVVTYLKGDFLMSKTGLFVSEK